MKNLDLEKINGLLDGFVNARDWDQFHSIKNLSMALAVESSELLELFQWQTEAQSNAVAKDADLKKRLEDEVADVFVYLLRIASKAEIELEQVVLRKIAENDKKYPAEIVRGKSKKYNEY